MPAILIVLGIVTVCLVVAVPLYAWCAIRAMDAELIDEPEPSCRCGLAEFYLCEICNREIGVGD